MKELQNRQALSQVGVVCQYLELTEMTLSFWEQEDKHLLVQGQVGNYRIVVPQDKPHLVYRGLSILAAALRQGQEEVSIEERVGYQDLGFMLDASRNAVLTVAASKKMIDYLALMGYSNFQLYMEDTYALPKDKYFGYFRGAYTGEELQEIERYAASYGMSFIPCIQTLAHLSAYVKWQVASVQSVRDVDDVLLIGDYGTYELIEQMFQALSVLESRRVNIGMDEAYLVGLGRYLDLHGYQNRGLIMCQHLERVLDIADKYGFHCSMWSDMFFKLLTKSKDYSGELEIDQEVQAYLNRLKKRVTLVYWDYYQLDREIYAEKFAKHQVIGEEIAFAGGAWKWMGYTPDNAFSLKIAPEAHAACQRYAVKEVTITGWGDNGGECSTFGILPSLQAWAELTYRDSLDGLADHFEVVSGVSLDDFLLLDKPNQTPSNPQTKSGFNPSRYILYQDILCPLLQEHIDEVADRQHFVETVDELTAVSDKTGDFAYLFATQAQLCRVLAIKSHISFDIRQAYKATDAVALQATLPILEELLQQLEEFRQLYSQQWLSENKVFGLDTVDIRLGGLEGRIKRAHQRISAYLNGQIAQLEELEVELLPYNDFYDGEEGRATTANLWHLIATASTISTT